jgi:hypothetical protein
VRGWRAASGTGEFHRRMQIIEHTHNRLVLEHRERWGPLVLGAFAVIMGTMAWFARHDAPGIAIGLLLIALMLAVAP